MGITQKCAKTSIVLGLTRNYKFSARQLTDPGNKAIVTIKGGISTMKVKILLLLFVLMSLFVFSGINLASIASAELKVAVTPAENEIQIEEKGGDIRHVLQQTNIFSILIVGLEIFIVIYLVGLTWHSGLR